MPHFIIECNNGTLKHLEAGKLVQDVFDVVLNSGLFSRDDIKSRLRTYKESLVAGENHDFIHVWGYIREGRSDQQKKTLSENIIKTIKNQYPDAYLVSCNIQELDKDTYLTIQL